MARLTIVSALLFLVGTVISATSPSNLFAILQGIGFVGLLIVGIVYFVRLLGWLKRKLFWKVRNRIIISFAFVGLIPVLILVAMGWFSVTLIFRQLSVVYLENEFQILEDTLHETGEKIVLRFYQSDLGSEDRLRELMEQERTALIDLYPGLANTRVELLRRLVRREETIFNRIAEIPQQERTGNSVMVPPWARDGFHGLVDSSERIFISSLLPVRAANGREYLVHLQLPMDQTLIEHIAAQTGISIGLLGLRAVGDLSLDTQVEEILSARKAVSELAWAHVLLPVRWANQVNPTPTPHGVVIQVPMAALMEHFFTEGEGFGTVILVTLAVLGSIFILVELLSLFVGVAIARSITRSIHNIYAGTQNIQAGNFDFRIPAGDRDQLDSMATAFNQMSESVVRLMGEVSDKERLEKEIEIAREVQRHLFPKEVPQFLRMELAGTCLAARHVSGDYYDFIPYHQDSLDIIIADISGKGISAALLMANLQSSIRSHVAYQAAGSNGDFAISQAVSAINRQLYTHTSPDKFATLVLARVDTERMVMTYCNAGHNHPLLISGGQVRRLDCGGMVAGLFETPTYEEETLPLASGDLVVFYTDGVVEAENPAGDQFEEERLEALVKQNYFLTANDLRGLIIDEVSNWVDGHDQKDDITVVTMKVAD